MSEFKGTPGPWEIQQGRFSGAQNCTEFSVVIPGGGGELKATVANWILSAENANLIAAAPDLLAACQDLLQHASVTEHMSAFSVEQARAAISKAIG